MDNSCDMGITPAGIQRGDIDEEDMALIKFDEYWNFPIFAIYVYFILPVIHEPYGGVRSESSLVILDTPNNKYFHGDGALISAASLFV